MSTRESILAVWIMILIFAVVSLIESDVENTIEKAKQHTSDEQFPTDDLRDVCGGAFIDGVLPDEQPLDC